MADVEAEQRILAVLERRNADGSYYYSDADMRDFLPLVFLELARQVDGFQLSNAAQAIVDEFKRRIGVPLGLAREAEWARIGTYFTAHPVNPELKNALEECLKQEVVLAASQAPTDALAFLGGKRAPAAVASDAPAVRAGPLAHAALATFRRD